MYSNLFVVLLGMGTVFCGLVLIIFLCKIMSVFVKLTESTASPTPLSATEPVSAQSSEILDKQPLLAAISAVVAEELGTDITNIRIHSIKKV